MQTLRFIPKILFGMLVMLGMAFGMLHIADALTFDEESRSGDLQTFHIGDTFSITFSVNLTSSQDIYDTETPRRQIDEDGKLIDSSGYKVRGITVGSEIEYFRTSGGLKGKLVDTSGYVIVEKTTKDPSDNTEDLDPGDRLTDKDGSYIESKPDDPVSDSQQYNYNDEAIAIVAPKEIGNLRRDSTSIKLFTDKTDRLVALDINKVSLIEETDNREVSSDKTLDSSITLTGEVFKLGEHTIKVVDMTHKKDFPTSEVPVERAILTFTLYVVPTADYTTKLSLDEDAKDGYKFGNDYSDPWIDGLFDEPDGYKENAPLTYKVEGPGSIYVQEDYPIGEGPKSVGSPTSELTTSASAGVRLDMDGGSNKITVWVRDQNAAEFSKSITYIFNYAELAIVNGYDANGVAKGAASGRLEDYIGIRVIDANNSAVPGLAIEFTSDVKNSQFTPYPGEKVYVIQDGKKFDDNAKTPKPTSYATNVGLSSILDSQGLPKSLFVQTDSQGEAKIYFHLGTLTNANVQAQVQTVTIQSAAPKKTFLATAVKDTVKASLRIVSGDGQRAEKGDPVDEPLVVLARSTAGYRIPGVNIRFTAPTGRIERSTGTALVSGTDGGNNIVVKTGSNGTVSVEYNIGQLTVAREVTAEIDNEQSKDLEYDFEVDRVIFNINGSAPAPAPVVRPVQPVQPVQPTIQPPSLSADISGAPGSTQTLSVNTEAIAEVSVGFSTDSFLTAGGRVLQRSFTGSRDVSIVLPNRVGIYTLTVTASTAAGGTSRDQRSIRVVEADNGGAGTLSVVLVGAQANGHQTLQVNAQTTAGAAVSGTLTVTLSGAGVSTTVATTNGSVRTIIALPATAGILTASATGYTSGLVTLPARTTPTTPTTTLPPVSEPSRITIGGAATRSGTVNEELEAPLLVRALDDNGDGVEDARVIFRVISGRGTLSDRGTGRAIGTRTDSNGYARADFTPLSAGSITVEAEVRGVNTPVTFTITTGSTPPTTGTTSTGGTPSTDISPVVHVAAASRPPMLWVEGGAIYALVGANIQEFAPSVDNALNLAVGGGKVYWTEKTGDSGGTINSANLDGTGVTELASIFAIPMGIAVDAAGGKLYWTASSGKIKRANLDGSGSENVVPGGLDTPMDLALADGNVYWTEANGSVRFVNLTGQKNVRDITPIGADTPGSLVIAGGKVYWTEKTAASAGTINSANLNGTDVRELTSIRSVPMGIAVDTARSKLYWTASSGKVKQANLNGSGAKNVVSGLGSPSDMVLSNSITETPAATTTTTTTTASRSKYDLNSDGTVDNTDAGLVADAMGTSNARYDVNGDGTVNFLDLLLVFDNRDPGAAGAPTIVGMKMSAAQIDIIEEQIDLLIATNDRSPSAMRTLVYLQQLLVTARPEKTRLLANYPNPFNPETWMPYELATDTPVKITIYTPQGVVIRTLQLGHQSAGYYVGRDRAAYWDGRNALGEPVASGLYFYQLETDEMSSMRKMVILK